MTDCLRVLSTHELRGGQHRQEDSLRTSIAARGRPLELVGVAGDRFLQAALPHVSTSQKLAGELT